MCSPNGTRDNSESELDSDLEGEQSEGEPISSSTPDVSDDSEIEQLIATEAAGDANETVETIEDEADADSDEIVQAFRRARDIQRNHPPDIECEDNIVDISFNPCAQIIALGTLVGDVLLYKYSNEECEKKSELEVHKLACRSIEFTQDGTGICSGARDKGIVLSDVETGKMKWFADDGHENPLSKIKVIDANRIATGDDEGIVKVWDVRQKDAVFSVNKMEDSVTDMITNEAMRYLVCSSSDGTLTTISLIDQQLHVQSEQYEEEFTSLCLVRHERKLVASTSKGRLYFFNWGQFGYHCDEYPGPKLAISCTLPLTENIIVSSYEDGKIRATHLFPHQQLGIVGQHSYSAENLDVDSQGELLASHDLDTTVKFWNIKYFEDVTVSERDKTDKRKVLAHNLPSSKAANAADFFADLAGPS